MTYSDPGYEPSGAKWGPFIEALKGGEAILTEDTAPDDGGAFRRMHPIGLYKIRNVRIEDGCLRFDFERWVCDVKKSN